MVILSATVLVTLKFLLCDVVVLSCLGGKRVSGHVLLLLHIPFNYFIAPQHKFQLTLLLMSSFLEPTAFKVERV